LTDLFFNWNNPPISTGSSCWFKVTAYSIDTTLQNTVITAEASIFDPTLITSIDVSVGDKIDNNLCNVYPNPTDGLLFLDLKEGYSYKYFQINDVFGHIILQKNLSNSHQVQFDISNQVAGLYFIRLFSEDTKVVSKFIKQ
jgi:hypothetical protein